jgi:tungstate transport system ATP-binding protein
MSDGAPMSPPPGDFATSQSRPRVLPIAGHGLVVTRSGRTIVAGVGIKIDARPRILVILGPNGAGKSLLLRVLVGLVPPDAGTLTWADTAPDRERAPRIGFVFQRPVMLRRKAIDNVAYMLRAAGVAAEEIMPRARLALEASKLEQLAQTPARLLSSGEQQRLALAGALAREPEILILDEPSSNLDPCSTLEIEERLRQARASGMCTVLVTHDLAQARRLADDIVFMHQGRILARGEAAAFFASPPCAEAAAYVNGEIVV